MSNEQSIRDELISALDSPQHAPMSTHSGYDGSCQDCPWQLSQLPPEDMADALLAHPVIRRIQAEALREARADIQAYTDSGSPFGHRPVEQFLDNRADRVERGETA